MAGNDDTSTATAVQTIAEKAGPEAAGLLVSLVEQDRRHLDWVNSQLREGAERDRDEWKERALVAEDRLSRAERNLLRLVFDAEEPSYAA
jgi:hypothetical protein